MKIGKNGFLATVGIFLFFISFGVFVSCTKVPENVTVKFDTGEGISAPSPIQIVKGGSVGEKLPNNITKDHFVFMGWFTEPEGNGSEINSETIITEDLTVHANWVRRPDFLLVNGTGSIITEIEIQPSKKTYPNNSEISGFQNISLNDTEMFAIILPQTMWEILYFDIAVKYKNGKDEAITKERVHVASVSNDGKVPMFVMHIDGKTSSVPLVGGAIGAGATAAGIAVTGVALSSGALMLGQAVGAAAITEALAMVGGVVGGGMVTGIGIVVAAPVAVGAAIWAIITIFNPADTLLVTEVKY